MPFLQVASILAGSLLAIEPVLTNSVPLPAGASSDFGYALSFTDKQLVVGAPTNIYDVNPDKIETVFVFNDSDWSLKDTIQYTNDTTSTRFGSALAVAGTRMVIGSPSESAFNKKLAGAVYTLEFDGTLWVDVPVAKLTSPIPEVGQRFGYSVAEDAQQLIVGAPGANTMLHSDAGAIFVYDKIEGGWSGPQVIFMDSPSDQVGFGMTMALSGEWLAVSAPEGSRESVVMLKRDPQTLQWAQTEELNSQSFVNDGCASIAEVQVPRTALVLQGDTLVIGDPLSSAAPGGGAVYVLRLTGSDWACFARVTPPSPMGEESFGSAVAMTDSFLLIGASHHSSEYANQGAIHVFQGTGAEYVHEGTVRGETMEDGLGKNLIARSTTIAAQISGENDDVYSALMIYELRASLGEPCDDRKSCAKGTCESGICCAALCTGTCFACASEDEPNPGECQFAEGVTCMPEDMGCVDNVCAQPDTSSTSAETGGTTLADDGGGTTGATASSGTDSGQETEDGSTADTDDNLPKRGSAGGTSSSEPGGVGFDPDELSEGCVCGIRRSRGGPWTLGLGLLVLLGLHRRCRPN